EAKEQEFKHTSKLLFEQANDLEPHRLELKKDDQWRQKERKLLALMTGEAPCKQSDEVYTSNIPVCDFDTF
ncbi:hypothetical protein, partial [Sansalvadorimonas verongulae]|uniref:hypothetical protein n=1 Tax=Sansalvadorimonas verongulae TaxID=2172824 RepID=UPI001E5C8681